MDCALRLAVFFALGLALSSPVSARFATQQEGGVESLGSTGDLLPCVLEGVVLAPDGVSAEGVLVTTSAGGRALTDESGVYRLELWVPPDLAEVQLDIRAPGMAWRSTVATANLASSTGQVTVGTTVLGYQVTGPACEPERFDFGPPERVEGLFTLRVGGEDVLHGLLGGVLHTWSGERWVPDETPGAVEFVTVHDDGSEAVLYGVAEFPGKQVLRRDSDQWTGLGRGNGDVLALLAREGPAGVEVFAGGTYTFFDGVLVNRLARWDGTAWSALGAGLGGPVRALAMFDDGGGEALYAAGEFMSAGGGSAANVARWDGSSWSEVGGGTNGTVHELAVLDLGSGPALYACGAFTTAGGVAARHVARWDGSSWTSPGGGVPTVSGSAEDVQVFVEPGGPVLYVGGNFSTDPGANAVFARWDGTAWSFPLGQARDRSELGTVVRELHVHDHGDGPLLHVVGSGPVLWGVVTWDGTRWTSGLHHRRSLGGTVRALAGGDLGTGESLFVGGEFLWAGGQWVRRVAHWDGVRWEPLGDGLPDVVRALEIFDAGAGPKLYVGGDFGPPKGLARWDGAAWEGIDPGVSGGTVNALQTFDRGDGEALYVVGTFGSVAGQDADGLARYDGVLLTAVDGPSVGSTNGRDAVVADIGDGPALWIGADGTLMRYTQSGLVPVGGSNSWIFGPTGRVNALEAFDGDGGPKIYMVGEFELTSPAVEQRVVTYDGSVWGRAPVPIDVEYSANQALRIHDDGTGPALYFTGGGSSYRWDGVQGVYVPAGGIVLESRAAGGVPVLYGGSLTFPTSFPSAVALNRWACDRFPPEIVCPGSFTVPDGLRDGPGERVFFTVGALDDQDEPPTVVCTPPSGSTFPPGTTTVRCSATDAAGNESRCSFRVTVVPKIAPVGF